MGAVWEDWKWQGSNLPKPNQSVSVRLPMFCYRHGDSNFSWAFPTSNEVNIFCNLRICMSRYCSFSNCSVEPSLAGESPSSNQLPQRHRREGRIAYSLITSNYGQRKNRGELDEIEPLQAARIRLRRQPAAGNTEVNQIQRIFGEFA